MRKLLALAALLIPLSAAPALANGLIVIDQRDVRRGARVVQPMWVKSHVVNVTIKGRLAITEVEQVFVNPNNARLEGSYLFPLPKGATIDEFSMWHAGQKLGAELLSAGKARKIYEDIVRRQMDPALLEFAEQGLLKCRIFPIEPNSEKRVRVRYAEVLRGDNGTLSYRAGLKSARKLVRPIERASVTVRLEADAPVASIFSPTHDIDTPSRRAGPLTFGWEGRDVRPDDDFLLYWRPTRKGVGVNFIAQRDRVHEDDGTFMLVLEPSPDAEAAALPKDVVFVVDTSGSMAGKKMDQAKAALAYCLRSLGPNDRFGIVPFSTEPRAFRDSLLAATPVNRELGERYVSELRARGGTAIDDALKVGLDLFGDRSRREGRPAMVFFVTDGLPTIGNTEPAAILRRVDKRAGDARLFVFGVGNDVNTRLLDKLAEDNRGTRDYVAESESIEVKVSSLFDKLARPAMTDVSVSIEGVATHAVHPRTPGDLFHGSELLVVGRYARGGNAVIRLRGRVNGQQREIVEEVRFPESESQNEFLPRLWAVRRVGYLLDEIRLRGESGEVKEEVVTLSKRYGIVTPYTSYLILEDEARQRPEGDGDGPIGPQILGFGGDAPSTGGGGGAPGRPAAPAPTEEESEALGRLEERARRAATADESDSGAAAVDDSRDRLRMKGFDGKKEAGDLEQSDEDSLVRHVSGRTFVSRGGIWWDMRVDLRKERRSIEEFSEEYFALLRKHGWIGKYLGLGRVVLEVDKEVIEITPAVVPDTK